MSSQMYMQRKFYIAFLEVFRSKKLRSIGFIPDVKKPEEYRVAEVPRPKQEIQVLFQGCNPSSPEFISRMPIHFILTRFYYTSKVLSSLFFSLSVRQCRLNKF